MNYNLDFIIKENYDELYDCLKVEKINKDRSNLIITKKKDCLHIKIEAKDPTALRATFDGIIKLIIVFDKLVDTK